MNLPIIPFGDGLGLILPDELLAHLKWSAGDTLSVAVSQDGSLRLTRVDPTYAKGMKIAREAMVEHAKTFKALAKS